MPSHITPILMPHSYCHYSTIIAYPSDVRYKKRLLTQLPHPFAARQRTPCQSN